MDDQTADRDYRARSALTREITARQAVTREESGFVSKVAKFAAIGAAGYLIGRRVIKSDVVIDALHNIGQVGRRLMTPITSTVRGMMDEFGGVVGREYTPVRSFDLMDHLTSALAVHDQLRASGHTAASAYTAVSAAQSAIRSAGFNNLERAGLSRFRAATVDDVMRQSSLQKAIGQRNFEVISRAHGLGMIGDKTALTRGNLGLLIKQGAPGQFVDTRWASPQFIAGGAANLLKQIQVPFLGLRPGEMLLSLMRPFGKGAFAGMIGRNLEVAPGVRSGSSANFVMGGSLYSYEKNGWTILSDNIRINPMGRVGQASLERMGNAENYVGRDLAKRVGANHGGFRGFLDKVQYGLGIGPAYRTRDPMIKTAILDPLARRDQGVVVANPYVRLEETLSWTEKLGVYSTAREAGQDPFRALHQAVKSDGELTWFDKLKAYFNVSRKATVLRPGAKPGPTGVYDPDAFVRGKFAGDSLEYTGNLSGRRTPVGGQDFITPGVAGTIPTNPSVPIEYYAYSGKGVAGRDFDLKTWTQGQANAALDIGHYLTNRLNDLFGMTIGAGFRPSIGQGVIGGTLALAKNVGKVYGLYGGFQGGMEYLNYADHLAEMAIKPVVTGFGLFDHPYTSPKKMAVGAYQAARLTQTKLREMSGITGTANYLEDLMPGSMSTGLSDLLRTVTPVVMGAMKAGSAGAKAGLVGSFLIGGSDPGKSSAEVSAEFRGDRLVPVRKSRWWVLGHQPWEGGQIDHYEPHWTKVALSDYKYTDVRYGSKDEYFTNVSPWPTPHNLFGLMPALSEGGLFGSGDLYLAKKHQYDRPYPDTPGIDQETARAEAEYFGARGPYDAPVGAGDRLGYGTAGSMPEKAESREGMLGRIGGQLGELTGMYKFLLWDMPGFGSEKKPKIGSYSEINSQAKDFWEASLGGMFGMTELYRRFNPPDEADPGINTVPNTMPTWLPGTRSDMWQDRTFGTDFSTGDPYGKVPHGEFRLPGPAYEVLHKLHSGTSGVYDPMDRFLVLADIAPNSASFREYRTIVESWEKAGVLDAYWSDKFQTTKRQVREKMERYKFYDRKFTGVITAPDAEKLHDRYNIVEKAVGGVYETFAHDLFPKVAETIPLAGTILTDKLFPVRSPVEHYQRHQIYGEEFADWKSPWRQLIRPKLHQLNSQDPLTAATGGAMFSMFGANPVAAFTLGGFGMLGLGASSAGRALASGEMTGGYVPDFREEEFALQEYFDKLQYMKSSMLHERAEAMGEQDLQEFYKSQMGRTVASLNFGEKDQHTFVMQSMRGMPRNQRAYLLPFMQMPQQAQDVMAEYLPPDLAPVFLRAAGRQYDSVFTPYREILGQSSEQRVAAFFSQNGGLPNAGWGGWHPDVPMDSIKIKMVDAGVGGVSSDIHKFDLFAEHRHRASRFDSLEVPVTRSLHHVMPHDGMDANLYRELQSAGFENIRLRHGVGDDDRVNWNVRRVLSGIGEGVSRFFD